MHLENQLGPSGNPLGASRGSDERHVTGGSTAQERRIALLRDKLVIRCNDEHDNVMDDRRCARPGLGALDPFVFGKIRSDFEVLIFDAVLWPDGRDREFILFLYREDQVRFTDGPAGDKLARRRQILVLSPGTTLIDPGQQSFALLIRETAVVGEFGIVGIGEPGGHAPFLHGFTDAFGPGTGIVISKKSHGANLTLPVTFLAVLLQNTRDIPAEGHAGICLWNGGAGNDAAGHRTDGLTHQLAGQHFIQGNGQITPRRLRAFVTNANLVVDSTVIANRAFVVEDAHGVGGYILGAPDTRDFEAAW